MYGSSGYGTATYGSTGAGNILNLEFESSVPVTSTSSVGFVDSVGAVSPVTVDTFQSFQEADPITVPANSTYQIPLSVTDDNTPVDMRSGVVEYYLTEQIDGSDEVISFNSGDSEIRREDSINGKLKIQIPADTVKETRELFEIIRISFPGGTTASQLRRRVKFIDTPETKLQG